MKATTKTIIFNGLTIASAMPFFASAQSYPQAQAAGTQTDNPYQGMAYAGSKGSEQMVSEMKKAFPGYEVTSVKSLPPSTNQDDASLLIGKPDSSVNNTSSQPQSEGESSLSFQDDGPAIMPESQEDIQLRKMIDWHAGAADQEFRQKGLKLGQGDNFYNSIANSNRYEDIVNLNRWKHILPSFGVTLDKIEFEASRKGRHAFNLWASRMVWNFCKAQKDREVCQITVR